MRRRPFGIGALLAGGRVEAEARRRVVVVRARITVDVPVGVTSLDEIEACLASAITAVPLQGGAVESVQVGLAVDPAWQAQGPPAHVSGDAAMVSRAG